MLKKVVFGQKHTFGESSIPWVENPFPVIVANEGFKKKKKHHIICMSSCEKKDIQLGGKKNTKFFTPIGRVQAAKIHHLI